MMVHTPFVTGVSRSVAMMGVFNSCGNVKRPGFFLLIAVVVGAHLLPPITTTAQAPSDAFDVFVVSDHGLVQYACQRVETTPATQEAPHETEIPITYEPPPTFTPAVFTSSTPAFPTPTQETSTSPTVAIVQTKNTVTPYPTQATTPMSACEGTVQVSSSLNVRLTPSVYATIAGQLYNGARVELHAYTHGDGLKWFRVWWASLGTWAYIAAPFVATDAACWGLIKD